MDAHVAYGGQHDAEGEDDVDWPDWIDDDEAVDRLLHDVVETLERDDRLRPTGRRERPEPVSGASPPATPDSHLTPEPGPNPLGD